jgi:hypothetical protein
LPGGDAALRHVHVVPSRILSIALSLDVELGAKTIRSRPVQTPANALVAPSIPGSGLQGPACCSAVFVACWWVTTGRGIDD